MLLSVQQKYILEVLRELGCVRRQQLHVLVREKFRRPDLEISEVRMETMLRQLRTSQESIRIDGTFVRLPAAEPDMRRLEAVDVMLELSEGRPQTFTARRRMPELLHFSLEGDKLRLFSVATLSDPLHGGGLARDSPGRVVWISDSGSPPDGLLLPRKHFFAARQPDGSHRFYGS